MVHLTGGRRGADEVGLSEPHVLDAVPGIQPSFQRDAPLGAVRERDVVSADGLRQTAKGFIIHLKVKDTLVINILLVYVVIITMNTHSTANVKCIKILESKLLVSEFIYSCAGSSFLKFRNLLLMFFTV